MHKIIMGVIGAALVVVAAPLWAQEDDTPSVFTYASYFKCTGGPLSTVDKIMADDAERLDGLVEDGTMSAWGWLAHHTGGQWQRISYHQAGSLDARLDASAAIQSAGDDDEESGDDGPGFGEICNTHDDYIWSLEAGMSGQERGKAGFSVYHVCDISREDRADEIVKEHVAPILDKMVEDGKLTSWGWLSHVVGGKFRRLQTMTAGDHKSLLAARAEALGAVYGEDGDDEAGKEFVDICGPHGAYMWNSVHETQ